MEVEETQKREYQYLKPSIRKKVGWFGRANQFDIRFNELQGTMVTQGFATAAWQFLTSRLNQPDKLYPRDPSGKEHLKLLEEQLPMVKPDFKHQSNSIRYTWIGHSTAVLQIGAETLMIDPVFADRASPYGFAGPKRYRPPACSIQELPDIDLVLVSHDHYDHLDEHALEQLHKKCEPIFVAGLDSGDVFPKKSILIEMDWMQTRIIKVRGKPYKITFVPVCHWSRRGMNDFNTRLWGGFVIQTPYKQKLFYSGDTGYCGVFKQIGHMFGPFDLAILPIGAYEPRHLLAPQHIDPKEAVIVHKEIKSKKSVGVHWGTFPLGRQFFFQARQDLEKAKKQQGLSNDEFVTVRHGESIVIE